MPNQISTGGFEVKGRRWQYEKSALVRLHCPGCAVKLYKQQSSCASAAHPGDRVPSNQRTFTCSQCRNNCVEVSDLTE